MSATPWASNPSFHHQHSLISRVPRYNTLLVLLMVGLTVMGAICMGLSNVG